MDDRVRDELARRAEEADVSVPVRQRVLAGVGRRRRWVRPVLAASVAVAATVALVAVVTRDVPRGGLTPPGTSVKSPTDVGADEWRTEYWRDVQVDVPADWWFGGSPLQVRGRPFACGAEPTVMPDGQRATPREKSSPAPGYVGRPIGQTDACEGDVTSVVPDEPYLWFDTPLEPGVVDLGEGWTQETIDINGSTITVATQDSSLRERIFRSATGGETCLANRDDLADPLVEPQPTDTEGPLLCAYRGDRKEAWLAYAAQLSFGQSRAFVDAFDAAPSWYPAGRGCDLGGPDSEWVTLHVNGTTYVVRLGFHSCPHVSEGGKLVKLTPALVEPWLVGGIPAVLYGPTGGMGAMLDSFIGMQMG